MIVVAYILIGMTAIAVLELVFTVLVAGVFGVLFNLVMAIATRWNRVTIPRAKLVAMSHRPTCARCKHTYDRRLGCCLCTWVKHEN